MKSKVDRWTLTMVSFVPPQVR